MLSIFLEKDKTQQREKHGRVCFKVIQTPTISLKENNMQDRNKNDDDLTRTIKKDTENFNYATYKFFFFPESKHNLWPNT